MVSTALYTADQVERARSACKEDPYINEICQTIATLYKHTLPVDVDVFWSGAVRMIMSPVTQQTVDFLRANMRKYILSAYPALSYLYAPTQVGGDGHNWSDPVEKPAGFGEFLVITDDDYCIKAMHYGNNDWQDSDTGKELAVELWTVMPAPPPGNKYRAEGVKVS